MTQHSGSHSREPCWEEQLTRCTPAAFTQARYRVLFSTLMSGAKGWAPAPGWKPPRLHGSVAPQALPPL
jgi:hypothetical protein